jgi:hypothetical protein
MSPGLGVASVQAHRLCLPGRPAVKLGLFLRSEGAKPRKAGSR